MNNAKFNSIPMKRIILFFLFLLPYISVAQTITGKIVNPEDENIPFANVVLCKTSDSTMISGCISNDNGEFSIQCEQINDKLLKISFVGYQTQFVKPDNSPLKITLQPLMLEEITVKGYKKIYELKNGEIVAKVKGTILETLPNANDIIAQLPFVSGQDGDFTIFGKGTPLIYINNRLVRDVEELNQLTTSEIKKININTMPGAKYDATVNSIIRIITEKPQGEGLSGTIYGQASRASLWAGKEYTSLNYRNKAWDIFGSAYIIQNRYKIDLLSMQQHTLNDNVQKINYQETENTKSNRISTVAGINFNPNQHHSAGIQYVFNKSDWRTNMLNDINYSILSKIQDTLQQLQQATEFDRPDDNHKINAYYSGIYENNFTLDINADWVTGNETDIMNSWFPKGAFDSVNTLGKRKYNLYSTQATLSYACKYFMAEAGAQYAYTDMVQTYDIDNDSLGIQNSNDITKQNRWAAFATIKGQLNNWGFAAGLRYEGIDFSYFKDNILNDEQSKIYNNLFPNVAISYAKDNFQATIGFERKIEYPTYGALRSNIQYSSPFIYESGNPILRPQIQNSFTAMVAYKDISAMIGYTIYEKFITQVIEIYNNKPIVLLKTNNINNVRNRFVAINYAPKIGFWRPNIEIGGQSQYFNLQDKIYDKPMFKIGFNNSFNLPKQWYVRVSADWTSGGNADMYNIKPSFDTNISISKRLFNNNLLIYLSINDLFKTDKTKWNINHGNLIMDYNKYSDTRCIKLTVQYDFNTTKSKYKGEASSDEMQRL